MVTVSSTVASSSLCLGMSPRQHSLCLNLEKWLPPRFSNALIKMSETVFITDLGQPALNRWRDTHNQKRKSCSTKSRYMVNTRLLSQSWKRGYVDLFTLTCRDSQTRTHLFFPFKTWFYKIKLFSPSLIKWMKPYLGLGFCRPCVFSFMLSLFSHGENCHLCLNSNMMQVNVSMWMLWKIMNGRLLNFKHIFGHSLLHYAWCSTSLDHFESLAYTVENCC